MSHLLIHILIKWIDLLALTPLIGIFVCKIFIPSSLKEPRDFRGVDMISLSILILGMTTLAELIARAMMISGRPFSALQMVLPSVITRTYFGPVLAVRFSLVILLGLLLIPQKYDKGKRMPEGILLLALCFTTSLLGHAGSQGTFTIRVFIDTVHLIAISCWIGGLLFLILSLPKQLVDESNKTVLLADAIARFSTIATTSVGILIATGVVNSFFQIDSMGRILTTAYGKVLVLKWGFLLPMLLLGFINKYIVLPKFQEQGKGKKASDMNETFYEGEAPSALPMEGATRAPVMIESILKWARVTNTPSDLTNLFFRLIRTEAVLGVVILLLTACLTQLSRDRNIVEHQPAHARMLLNDFRANPVPPLSQHLGIS